MISELYMYNNNSGSGGGSGSGVGGRSGEEALGVSFFCNGDIAELIFSSSFRWQ